MRSLKLLGLAASIVSCSSASAAVISTISATWPTSPAVQTIDALSVTNANRGVSGTRIEKQSFRTTSDITIGSIFLSSASYNNQAFNISFFNTVNTNASPLVSGTQVGSTITVDPFGSNGNGNLQIDLAPAEQFTLPAATSPAGYIMQIQLTDTASAAAFNWVHANTGVDIYTLGRYRRDDGDQTNTRDFGLAINAVPEPATLSMLAVGGMLGYRRRRA